MFSCRGSLAHTWLLGNGWTLMAVGLLVAVLACFQNDDRQLFADGRFEGEGDHRGLVVPGGIGADLRMRGKIAGSPIETDRSSHVRVREALRVLLLNKWVEVEQTVGELRIRPVNEHEAERRRVALDVASGSATRSW